MAETQRTCSNLLACDMHFYFYGADSSEKQREDSSWQSLRQEPYRQTNFSSRKSWWPRIQVSNARRDGPLYFAERSYEREVLLKKYNAKLCEACGVVQPQYVEVPASLLSSTRELKKFFDAGYSYVASLKPKPTARKKQP
jgi:hypothetical protein